MESVQGNNDWLLTLATICNSIGVVINEIRFDGVKSFIRFDAGDVIYPLNFNAEDDVTFVGTMIQSIARPQVL